MKNNKVYRVLGIVFMVGGLASIPLHQMGIFAAWFSIGAAFLAIGFSDKSDTNASTENQKKRSKK